MPLKVDAHDATAASMAQKAEAADISGILAEKVAQAVAHSSDESAGRALFLGGDRKPRPRIVLGPVEERGRTIPLSWLTACSWEGRGSQRNSK
jgi:hypothetical protein